ncbi:MAG: Dam family site-specific DNA-(adenine-N6)-methyltransferase [Roseburia sp.]|nr:Dam family site-specific DNA-(adenine-N6)-methyltransferase [Roseburia sp.]
MKDKKISSFLKWPGGKRWFINHYLWIIPTKYNIYYEPFLGGGSVLFALQPRRAVVADMNCELINLYIVMRDNPNELKKLMKQHQCAHCQEYYYQMRGSFYKTDLERAARFLYLNRTCFNGMYRVNKEGLFNVPIGTKNNCIYDVELFDKYSQILKGVKISTDDFEKTIAKAQKDDLIFADPPYTVKKNQAGFIKYNDQLFTWNDQQRLYNCLYEAKNRGVIIILTNVNCKEIREMYISGGFFIRNLKRVSTIAGNASKRGAITELLITSYEVKRMGEEYI